MGILKEVPGKYSLSRGFAAATDLSRDEVPEAERGTWWMPTIGRKELKALMKREDSRPLANYLLWLALLGASGAVACLALGTWWAIAAFVVYGTIYSSCDPRSHDLGHAATFRTRWLNTLFCNLTLLMTLKEPVMWRWRHARHHTDTIHVGRDPEILVTRPADLLRIGSDLFFLRNAKEELTPSIRHALGIISPDARHYVPASEWRRMIWSARLLVGSVVAVVGLCVYLGSVVPLLFVWGPRFYANWLNFFGFLSQHAGLAEDSYDHRLNTRTFLMNPALEFLYANMNYHIEHHLYPLIPYYNLPKLHAAIRDQLPYTYRSLTEVTLAVLPIMWRQAFDADYFDRRTLPAPGERVSVQAAPAAVHLFDPASGRRLG